MCKLLNNYNIELPLSPNKMDNLIYCSLQTSFHKSHITIIIFRIPQTQLRSILYASPSFYNDNSNVDVTLLRKFDLCHYLVSNITASVSSIMSLEECFIIRSASKKDM